MPPQADPGSGERSRSIPSVAKNISWWIMFYIICYDIVDDRLRDKVVKQLKGVGCRAQKSVFECPDLSEKQFLKLKDVLEGIIDHTQDSVRYYRQCKACLEIFEWSGVGDEPFTGSCGYF